MYENLKDEIRSVVRPNFKSQINGQNLQDVLIDMVDNYPTGSEDIPPILAKTGSWDNAATWVTNNSGSLVTSESLYPVVQDIKDTYVTTASLENVSSSLNDKIEGVSSSLGDSIQDVKDTYATTASLNELSESIASTFPQYATTESLNQVSSSLNEKIDGAISGSGFATTESLNNLSSSIAQDFSKYATTASVNAATESVKQWVEDKHYLTEHQDISGLATTASLNSLSSSVGVMSASFNQRINSITGSGGSGSTVVVSPILTSGTKIAEITVDGSRSDLYAPQGGGGSGSNSPWEYGPGSSSAQTLGNSALGESSIAEGDNTTASGDYSHAEGSHTLASDLASHAEGNWTSTRGGDEGYAGNICHAEGHWTWAVGDTSHAEGQLTAAAGAFSHAEGQGESRDVTIATTGTLKVYQVTAGYTYFPLVNEVLYRTDTHYWARVIRSEPENYLIELDLEIPAGNYRVLSGPITVGNYSHAEGKGTITTNHGEHAEGMFNKSTHKTWNWSTIHSVGIGSSYLDRRNAFEIQRINYPNDTLPSGSVFVLGVGGYDGTNATASVNDLATVLNNYETWTFILEDSSSVTKSVLVH